MAKLLASQREICATANETQCDQVHTSAHAEVEILEVLRGQTSSGQRDTGRINALVLTK